MCGAPHAGGGGHTTSNWARVAVVLFGSASTARPLTHFGMPSRRGGRLYFYCTCCGDGEEQLCCLAAPAGTLQMGCIRLQFPANRCPLSPRFGRRIHPWRPLRGEALPTGEEHETSLYEASCLVHKLSSDAEDQEVGAAGGALAWVPCGPSVVRINALLGEVRTEAIALQGNPWFLFFLPARCQCGR